MTIEDLRPGRMVKIYNQIMRIESIYVVEYEVGQNLYIISCGTQFRPGQYDVTIFMNPQGELFPVMPEHFLLIHDPEGVV